MKQVNQNERSMSNEYSLESLGDVSFHQSEVVDSRSDRKNRIILYKKLFSTWMPRLAVIPSFILGSTPILLYLIVGIVLNAHSRHSQNNTYKALKEIRDACIYMVDLALISGVCKFLNSFCWIRIGSEFSLNLRKDLFVNMMKSDVSFFDTNPIGGIMTLLSEDSQLVQEAFGSTKGTQISNLSQFLVGIILAYSVQWKMALIATSVIPISLILILLFSKCINIYVNLKFLNLSESMTIAEETVAAIRTLKGFNRESHEHKRFMKYVKNTRSDDRKIGFFVNCMFFSVDLLMFGMILGNLYWGCKMVQSGILEAGNVFSVFGYLIFGGYGIIELQASLQGEQKAIASGGRILELTHHVPSIPFEGGKKIDDFQGKIEFKNVSFKYPTRDVYVLKNVSFTINPGQMGALVGHSGSGKSTCVQLLERYYDCESGEILLDGVNIKELDLHWLHKRIALVSQEPSLFQMTIKENIRYGKPHASHSEVESAAEIANAKKFISKFEKGFDQMVGEKGSTLSGGQRQRVAIARAVILDPVILITDEATSALDADSEKKVQVALDKVMKDRTAVIVAHRLSTIRNAHIIYVFDSGEIKESGTHEELISKHGFYFELVRRQLTKEEVDEANEGNKKLNRFKIDETSDDKSLTINSTSSHQYYSIKSSSSSSSSYSSTYREISSYSSMIHHSESIEKMKDDRSESDQKANEVMNDQ